MVWSSRFSNFHQYSMKYWLGDKLSSQNHIKGILDGPYFLFPSATKMWDAGRTETEDKLLILQLLLEIRNHAENGLLQFGALSVEVSALVTKDYAGTSTSQDETLHSHEENINSPVLSEV